VLIPASMITRNALRLPPNVCLFCRFNYTTTGNIQRLSARTGSARQFSATLPILVSTPPACPHVLNLLTRKTNKSSPPPPQIALRTKAKKIQGPHHPRQPQRPSRALPALPLPYRAIRTRPRPRPRRHPRASPTLRGQRLSWRRRIPGGARITHPICPRAARKACNAHADPTAEYA